MYVGWYTDPFFESMRQHFGQNSRVEQRWYKLFNSVGSFLKKYESIEDYSMGVYNLYFYLNNGRAISRILLMDWYRYSYAEDLLVSWATDIENEIRYEAHLINVTASCDIEQKWMPGPLIGPKNDKWKTKEWETKWDSSKKEDKVMTKIKDVIFNNPATIVKWADGTKTVVKVQKDEPYDEEKGLAMAFIKKVYGNKGNYNDIFRKWCPKKEVTKEDDYECESCKINL